MASAGKQLVRMETGSRSVADEEIAADLSFDILAFVLASLWMLCGDVHDG
jgi:hypothetical protein